MEFVRMHLIVSGRVQGVGFRNYTRHTALTLDIRGWVRNLKDGRVEAVIEGTRENVEAMLVKLRKGPLSAAVSDLQVTESDPGNPEFVTFEVKHTA